MKKLFFVLGLLIFSFLLLIYWGYSQTFSPNNSKEFQDFLVVKGSSAIQIGNKLQKEGLIKNSLVFRVYMVLSGKSKNLPSGEYRLSSGMSMFEIIKQLEKGPLELWVTIPEGLRREEIATRFQKALGKNDSFYEEFIELSRQKEGMLFPETYLFPKEVTATQIVNKMVKTYDDKTSNLKNNSGLTDAQVLVLASLIERETKTDAERPIVAGIIMNRINSDWPLQIDAAVQYAVSNENCKLKIENCQWWPILTRDDLDKNSPFNTYQNIGLPPNPICSPGLSSIKAAMSPEKSDYWFYIHAPNGQIYYGETLSDHNANIRKYLGK